MNDLEKLRSGVKRNEAILSLLILENAGTQKRLTEGLEIAFGEMIR